MIAPADQAWDYFTRRVEVQTDGCWYWVGTVSPQGYGVAAVGREAREGAHRLGYRLLSGEIPEGLTLDHQCHNRDANCPGGPTCRHRRCVNPLHLEAVDAGVNTLRGKTNPALNLQKQACPEGHEYDYICPTRGWRKCLKCERAKLAAKQTPGGKYAIACVQGHPYTPENTLKTKKGRACRECNRLRLERNRRAGKR